MALTPSQLISAQDIDDAYDKLHGENETLKMEHAALAQALEQLVDLENHTENAEKDDQGLFNGSPAWEAARQVLSTLEA